MLILHNYFRSSTSIRVRVALNIKSLDYQYASYALLDSAHQHEDYLALNPQGLVPALQISPDKVLGQSLAIIEYLNDCYPDPPLLPQDPLGKARVRSLAMMIACDIHPLNNLRVLQTLRTDYGADDKQVTAWFHRWVHAGFSALEQALQNDDTSGDYCYGDQPGLADICLYAQMLNNVRFDVDTSGYKRLTEIFQRCSTLDAFEQAHPKHQPDAT